MVAAVVKWTRENVELDQGRLVCVGARGKAAFSSSFNEATREEDFF